MLLSMWGSHWPLFSILCLILCVDICGHVHATEYYGGQNNFWEFSVFHCVAPDSMQACQQVLLPAGPTPTILKNIFHSYNVF